MAHTSQKTLGLILAVLALPAAAAELTYQVRHEHFLRDKPGTLVIGEQGVSYQEIDPKGKKKPEQLHHGRWDYVDIQQLYLAPQRLVVLLYQDRSPWLLGVDQEFEFYLQPSQDLKPAYEMLKDRLDRRFVAALADESAPALWQVPVRRLGTLKGAEGVLRIGPDHVVFESARREQSRTWRMQDIENVSSSDPYQFTLTTHERAQTHYGSRKDFNFQLKQPLDEKQYQLLWRRLNQGKGLQFLTSLQQDAAQP